MNIASFLKNQQATPDRVLYRHYESKQWVDLTAQEMAQQAGRWQEAFKRLQLSPGARVAICLRNSAHWVALDQAILGAGLVCVPLYVDDNPGNVAYCISNSGAELLVVENERIARALQRTEVPLPSIVVLRMEPQDNPQGLQSVDEFLPKGSFPFNVVPVQDRQLATICYTSGTSGKPKGVKLSHQNITANVKQCQALGIAQSDDTFLSFLPMSHMFERTGGYYLPLSLGAKVVYSRGVAQLPEDLEQQAPTVMFAVPRIFEKFYARVHSTLAESPKKLKLFNQMVESGWRVENNQGSVWDHFRTPMLRSVVGKKILSRLGGRLRLAVVGGAALDPRIAKAFIAMGLPIIHGYGMTEASPVISVNLFGKPGQNVPESVGPPLPGIEIRLGQGNELQVKADNVMLGYWLDDQATQNSIMSDGWLRTGDVGQLIDERIYIRGRIKDIVVLSNGEKCSPQDVEMAIIGDPVFEQVMLVGEGKPFLSLVAVAPQGSHLTERELLKRANAMLKDFPRYVRVRRLIVTDEPWTVDNNLATPTMKIKRNHIAEKFSEQIAQVYEEGMAGDE